MLQLTLAVITNRIARIKGDLSALENQVVASRFTMSTKNVVTGAEVEITKPSINYSTLQAEYQTLLAELLRLETARAVANATTEVVFDGTPTYLITLLNRAQQLRSEISRLTTHISWGGDQPATQSVRTVGENAVEYVDTTTWHIQRSALRAQIRELQNQFDQLNSCINAVNHSTLVTIQ